MTIERIVADVSSEKMRELQERADKGSEGNLSAIDLILFALRDLFKTETIDLHVETIKTD